ncbi:MAG: hypothetical protein IKH02_07010 [Prevotella sp.]|nr:hypothetical protein [Prevotella sp.]
MKTIIICVLCLLPIFLQAQNERYFPTGTTWEEENYVDLENGDLPISRYFRFTVSGDTVINDKTYKCVDVDMRVADGDTPTVLFYYQWHRTSPWHWERLEREYYDVFIREDGDKVYYYDGAIKQEFLKYDFDWSIGKQIPMGYDYDENNETYICKYFTIKEISQIKLLDDNLYDCLYTDKYDVSIPILYQINGVGNVDAGGLFKDIAWMSWSTGIQYYQVMNFARNGQLLYETTFDEVLANLMDLIQVLGIRNVHIKRTPFLCYGIDGMKKKYPTKGLNIMQMPNGSLRKVMIK